MTRLRTVLQPIAAAYVESREIALLRFLGDGNDGAVWETSRQTAIKALERPDSFQRELAAYLRLEDRGVTEINGLAVPQLIDHHDTLRVVEMTIVFPPCILDFAKAYVDIPPDYPAEAISDWRAEAARLFGQNWPRAQSVLGWLRSYGIYYYDTKPGNILFE